MPELEQRVEALLAAFRAADERMRGMPVHNPALEVEAVGFRVLDDAAAGILITPWFMNVMFVPMEPGSWDHLRERDQFDRPLPKGPILVTVGVADGLGPYLSCSLFSPMALFTDQSMALETARAAWEELTREPERARPVDRREALSKMLGR